MTSKIVEVKAMNIKDIQLEIQEVKEHNDFLQRQNNALRLELQRIKSMGMFEFANEFCSEDQLEDAGHAFARSLGVGVHDDNLTELEFTSNGEAHYEATWNINCGDDF
jgi:hypothetical protein